MEEKITRKPQVDVVTLPPIFRLYDLGGQGHSVVCQCAVLATLSSESK